MCPPGARLPEASGLLGLHTLTMQCTTQTFLWSCRSHECMFRHTLYRLRRFGARLAAQPHSETCGHRARLSLGSLSLRGCRRAGSPEDSRSQQTPPPPRARLSSHPLPCFLLQDVYQAPRLAHREWRVRPLSCLHGPSACRVSPTCSCTRKPMWPHTAPQESRRRPGLAACRRLWKSVRLSPHSPATDCSLRKPPSVPTVCCTSAVPRS